MSRDGVWTSCEGTMVGPTVIGKEIWNPQVLLPSVCDHDFFISSSADVMGIARRRTTLEMLTPVTW